MNFRIVICLCFITITGILGDPGKLSRIYGGSRAIITDFPFVASIRSRDSNQLICGGSIISNWNILTAAHCLYLFYGDFGNVRVYTGSASSIGYSGNSFEIDYVVFHPHFTRTATSEAIFVNDIGVIKLHSIIEFNDFQKPIPLPSRAPFGGNMALIFGWGETEHSYLPAPLLKKAPVVLLTRDECRARLPIVIQEGQLCSFQQVGVGICTGDGGGAVVSNGEIYGVISYCVICGQGLPDVHTEVYQYLPFIRASMHT